MIITEYNHIRRTKLRILVEVLVMIVLVRIDNNTRYWLRQTDGRRIYNI
jgi:ACR3 family arsenite efflux pump ArsB